MIFEVLARIGFWIMSSFVVALAATVALQLLTGTINSRRLLYGRRRDGSLYFNPLKVQMLLATIAIATYYLLSATELHGRGLPRPPDEALYILGASHATYLGGKGWSILRRISPEGEN